MIEVLNQAHFYYCMLQPDANGAKSSHVPENHLVSGEVAANLISAR